MYTKALIINFIPALATVVTKTLPALCPRFIIAKGHAGPVRAVCLTPDGRHAVSGPFDNTLKVWDLETGIFMAVFTGDGPISAVAVAPDGRTIIAGERSGRVHFLRLGNSDA